ncbi:MAG: hypothetical protein LBN97_04110 [Oscillospiraceae bacterium]|jgi:dsDNA-specific endonuclease/ATPase MutS2|nr:hypothetical protein [Oscillospiraceae bacterium]
MNTEQIANNKLPSLLYSAGQGSAEFPPELFGDLKLDTLLSERAIDSMRPICAAADILPRQAVFADCSAHLAEWQAASEAALAFSHQYKEFGQARSEPERNYRFAALYELRERFRELSRVLPGESGLVRAFREYFSGGLPARIGVPDYISAGRAMFAVSSDTMFIKPYAEQKTLAERLADCAERLGFPESLRSERTISIAPPVRVIESLSELNAELFAELREFYTAYSETLNSEEVKYADELNLYTELAALYRKVPHCLPKLSDVKQLKARDLRDISLLAKDAAEIVPNDAEFTLETPVFFLVGANGGGKTTYLRSIGIAAVLGRSGFPVAAESCTLYPFSSVFTHFPREERFEGTGRFGEEQRRVREILTAQDGGALILLNETYSTTGEAIAREQTALLAEEILRSGSFGLYITHQRDRDERNIPVLTVVLREDNSRTYKILSGGVKLGGSYARDILKKYGLDF